MLYNRTRLYAQYVLNAAHTNSENIKLALAMLV